MLRAAVSARSELLASPAQQSMARMQCGGQIAPREISGLPPCSFSSLLVRIVTLHLARSFLEVFVVLCDHYVQCCFMIIKYCECFVQQLYYSHETILVR
jgi:hypothetical protein